MGKLFKDIDRLFTFCDMMPGKIDRMQFLLFVTKRKSSETNEIAVHFL